MAFGTEHVTRNHDSEPTKSICAWAGIKKHGQAARDALTTEFAQLMDYKGAYEPIHAADLTKKQLTSAL